MSSKVTAQELRDIRLSYEMDIRDYSACASAKELEHWAKCAERSIDQHVQTLDREVSEQNQALLKEVGEAYERLQLKLDAHRKQVIQAQRGAFMQLAGEVIVTQNEQKNGVEIKFPNKPAQAIINELNQSDFKWSRKQNIWYAKRTADTLAFAYEIAGMANGAESYQLSAAEILEVRKLQQTATALVASNTVSMAVFVAKRSNQPAVAQAAKQIDFSYLLN